MDTLDGLQAVLERARADYAFHMAAVRRGTDPDLRRAHLARAAMAYRSLDTARDAIYRIFSV